MVDRMPDLDKMKTPSFKKEYAKLWKHIPRDLGLKRMPG
jgi:hypothetical protein